MYAIRSYYVNSPHAVILAANGGVYVADIGNARIRLIKDGVVSTVAGNGTSGMHVITSYSIHYTKLYEMAML